MAGGSLGPDIIQLPTGTTAQRPGSPAEGQLRYNTTTKGVEFYNGSGWASISAIAPSPIQSNNNTWFYMNMSDPSSVSGSTIVNTATGTSAISDTLPLVSGASRSSGAGSFILNHTSDRQDMRRDIGGDPFAPATHGISLGTLFYQAHAPSNDRGLILYGDDGTDNHLFVRVHFQADNSISVGEDTNSSDVWTQTDTGITSGSWYFFVVTIATDGTMHTSVNGAAKVQKRSGGSAPTPTNAHFGLLGDLYNDNASQFDYATAFWYKGVLTDQQITDEYNYLKSVWTTSGI